MEVSPVVHREAAANAQLTYTFAWGSVCRVPNNELMHVGRPGRTISIAVSSVANDDAECSAPEEPARIDSSCSGGRT